MKRRFLSLLIGVGMVALIFPPFSGNRAARLADDYPLVCRGTETFKLDPPVACEGCVNVTTDEPLRYVAFTFIRGSKPSGKGLAPGECSWLDRGMWADEPNRLVQEIELALLSVLIAFEIEIEPSSICCWRQVACWG